MIRPANFGYNPETASSNYFQKNTEPGGKHSIQELALNEFENFVKLLKNKDINVVVFDDTPTPTKPDAVFSNNWVTFHKNGTVVLYPISAENRRTERRVDIIEDLRKNFKIKNIIDLTRFEKENRFLEGTGSIVFDHLFRFSYASLSSRTDKNLFVELSMELGYHPIYFNAKDEKGKELYHTNVMMCISEQFAIICSESIKNPTEQKLVTDILKNTGREIIEISLKQLKLFAGNMLSVKTHDGNNLLIMSEKAHSSLDESQLGNITKYNEILVVPLNTIETIGGGSVRCMMTEIFLPELLLNLVY